MKMAIIIKANGPKVRDKDLGLNSQKMIILYIKGNFLIMNIMDMEDLIKIMENFILEIFLMVKGMEKGNSMIKIII